MTSPLPSLPTVASAAGSVGEAGSGKGQGALLGAAQDPHFKRASTDSR